MANEDKAEMVRAHIDEMVKLTGGVSSEVILLALSTLATATLMACGGDKFRMREALKVLIQSVDDEVMTEKIPTRVLN